VNAGAWGDSFSAERHRDAEQDEKKRGWREGEKKGRRDSRQGAYRANERN
jgi:hypothetical protein